MAHLPSHPGRGDECPAPAEFDPCDILPGLSPRLVSDLAHLEGSTLDDLHVTFQVMPWGDRATLAAYKVVELDDDSSKRPRGLRVNESAVQLVQAAADLVREAADLAAVAHVLDKMGAPATDTQEVGVTEPLPLVDLSTVEAQHASEGRLVYGVVKKVEEAADITALTLVVPVASVKQRGSVMNKRVGLSVEVHVAIRTGDVPIEHTAVVIEYSPTSHQPRSIAEDIGSVSTR